MCSFLQQMSQVILSRRLQPLQLQRRELPCDDEELLQVQQNASLLHSFEFPGLHH